MTEQTPEPDRTDQAPLPAPGSGGVFITRGLTIRVKGLHIAIHDDGRMESTAGLDVGQDVTPVWLEIALHHCEDAKRHSELVIERARVAEDEQLAAALELEFTSSMQACVAAAIALDAFYGKVKERISLPPETTALWRQNRVARHAQIAEVLRRSFKIDQKKVAELKHLLAEVFRFRDGAVHPTPEPKAPVRRPDLNLGLEWRFVLFRFYNARVVTKLALSLIWQCSHVPRDAQSEVAKYSDALKSRLAELHERYRKVFGHTTEDTEPSL